MRLNTLKKTLAAFAFIFIGLIGSAQIAEAQTSRSEQRKQQEMQRIEMINQKRMAKVQDDRMRADQKMEQSRIRSMRSRMANSDKSRYRVSRGGAYYETNNAGAELLKQAVNSGYQEGYRNGRNDRYSRRSSSYTNNSVYRKGNYGYQSYVDSAQYKHYFQQGFQKGYDDGFNSRYENGSNNNGSITILGTVLQSILPFEQF